MTKKESTVWPVFYHVDPSDVRNQEGSFGEAFLSHAKDADEKKEKTIEMWKEALKKAGERSGYHLENQSEAEFVQMICKAVIAKLNRKPLHVDDNIIGMDFHMEQLKPLIRTELDEVHMVGIVGPGGIGKTTISMVICNHISSQFDGFSFLKNVGGQSEAESGLVELQKTILQDILKCEKPDFNNIHQGLNLMKERLISKRVLIVLDDVDEYKQLEYLGRKHGCYGVKSIIIITTKNKHLLDQHKVKARYEVRELNDKDSYEVFNWWAFDQSTPIAEFESLSKSVVKYAAGFPIALKVLGGLFCNMSVDEWESQLNQLQEIPDMTIQKVLKVSYDKLGSVEQEIFLDIVCFFRGEDKDFVSRILGSNAVSGIRVLCDRCLITISENKLDMHDLLQQMGQEIVRQQCPKEPGKRSRLWDPTDVQHVLTEKTATAEIEGLHIRIPESRQNQIQLSRDSFIMMNRLRLLKVDSGLFIYGAFRLPIDFELSSSKLSYFHCWGYPLESLPKKFQANNLVELNLEFSKIKRLWKEREVLKNLKVINLRWSKNLVEMPDFASVPNLEILNLEECSSLESLPRNFNLEHLRSLYCRLCRKLKSFPQIQGNMSKLREIDLSWTAIKKVPSSIGLLNGLEYFNLSGCENLVSLPQNLHKLKHLRKLDCSWCSKLKSFPQIKGNMSTLREINLSGTAIVEVPSRIENLNKLEYFDLSRCTSLASLPESICNLRSLKTLNLSEMDIKELPSSIGHLEALQTLNLLDCTNLEKLPDSICDLRSLKELHVIGCSKLERLEVTPNEDELLSCRIVKPGVVWLFGRFSSFKTLNLQCCSQMEAEAPNHHHILSLSSLIELSVHKESVTSSIDGFHLSSLQVLSVGNFNPMTRGIVSDIFLQSSLRRLALHNCNLMDEGIIPTNIWNLSSLVSLSLSNCNLREGDILNHICHLLSLERLSLEGNNFSTIPASINQLSNLEGLNLSHCKELQVIPELPSSLRGLNMSHCKQLRDIPELPSSLVFLDAHCSDSISSSPSLLSVHSLFNRFESKLTQETNYIRVGASEFEGMGMSMIIPRSSKILEMVRNPSMGSDEVTIELPRNWYENNDLLGFPICSVRAPVPLSDSEEDETTVKLECHLTVSGNNQSKYLDRLLFYSWCAPCYDCGSSDKILWVIYYPKDAIKEECRSNEWTHFTASFRCRDEDEDEDEWTHLTAPFRCCDEDEDDDDDDDDDENNNRSTTEDVKRKRDDEERYQSEEQQHKRSREPNTDLKL